MVVYLISEVFINSNGVVLRPRAVRDVDVFSSLFGAYRWLASAIKSCLINGAKIDRIPCVGASQYGRSDLYEVRVRFGNGYCKMIYTVTRIPVDIH